MRPDETKLIELIYSRGDFEECEDGYVTYWPYKPGSLTAANLRTIADELDRRNAEWDAIVRKEIG